MEYNTTCQREHTISRVDDGTYQTGPTFEIHCDGQLLSRSAFRPDVTQATIDTWKSDTIKQHQIDFLVKTCAELAYKGEEYKLALETILNFSRRYGHSTIQGICMGALGLEPGD